MCRQVEPTQQEFQLLRDAGRPGPARNHSQEDHLVTQPEKSAAGWHRPCLKGGRGRQLRDGLLQQRALAALKSPDRLPVKISPHQAKPAFELKEKSACCCLLDHKIELGALPLAVEPRRGRKANDR